MVLVAAVVVVAERVSAARVRGPSEVVARPLQPRQVLEPRPEARRGGPPGVGERTETVVEPGRVTCVPSTHVCSERSYLLEVYYPASVPGSAVADAPAAASATPWPLIVFAAGFDEDPSAYAPLIDAWVRAGYVVAAPRFPLSSAWALRTYGVNLGDVALADAFESDMLNEPGDLEAAYRAVAQLDASGPLAGRIALGQAAAIGQSDGGDVVVASSTNTCCELPWIRAAVVLSGAIFPPFGGTFFARSVPLLVVQGSADTVNPPAASQAIYDEALGPKYLEWLSGADHLEAYTTTDAYEQVVARVTVAFLDTYLRGEPPSATQLGTVGTVAGLAEEQSDGST